MTNMLVAKQLIFNGRPKEIFGEVVRVATPQDRTANNIADSAVYLIVDFTYGNTDYRGIWRQDDCLIAL
jgi:hypothetical protein